MLEHEHVSAEHLADYLRGDLDEAITAVVEEHISSCLVCARALREEAQLEMLLYEALETPAELERPAAGFDVIAEPVADRPAVASRSRRALWQRVAATVANTAAAAAALILVVSPPVVNDLVQRYAAEGDQLRSLDKLPDILRVIILYGFILYALTRGKADER